MAVKSCTKDIHGNPAPEQVEKLFWERETGLLATAQLFLFPQGKGLFSIAMKRDRNESRKTRSL